MVINITGQALNNNYLIIKLASFQFLKIIPMNMTYLKTFARSMRKNKDGICNYAKHQLTSASIEAGNVSIGLIRKRARGIRDTEYFKLKIRQTSIPDEQSMFYFGQNLTH